MEEIMITTHKKNLQQKCKERLYDIKDVMECVVKQEGEMWTIDPDHPKYPATLNKGVGTELKNILSTMGIHSSINCRCRARAIKMNSEGIDWCKENRDTIVDWLQEEARTRKLPFVKFAGYKILNWSIKRAEKNS
jgi:hypothetical protein